jgi:hypothetical protein
LKNTKIVTLLSTFSSAEIKKFRDFVNSPYYNKNKNVIRLNEALVKFHPDYDSKLLTEEHIYSKVFGEDKFDYFKIKNISSDLYTLGLEFLRHVANPTTDFINDYNLIVQLRLRKLFNLHKKLVKSTEESFKKVEYKDSPFLYNNYLLTMESQIVDLFEKPSSISGILVEFESFYEYLIFHLLQYYNLMIHIGKENNVNIDIKMVGEIVSYLEKGPASSHPVTLSYQYLILLKIKGKEEYYFKLKENYFKNFAEMDAASAYRVHMHMFGYCADMYNFKGDRRFVKEGYELYKHSYLNNRVTSGELLYPDFVNFIKVFVRAGDIELAEKFISDYKHQLPEDQFDNSINFSKAYIAHFKGDLVKALKYVSMVNFPLAILKVQSRIMEVQLNYQLEYYEETRSLIDAFKKTLVKEVVISGDFKNSILSFLKKTTNLINLIQETNRKTQKLEAKRLSEIIGKQSNHFGVKFWLEDRIKELIK